MESKRPSRVSTKNCLVTNVFQCGDVEPFMIFLSLGASLVLDTDVELKRQRGGDRPSTQRHPWIWSRVHPACPSS